MNQLDTSKATSQEDFPTWLSKDGKEDICVPMQNIINSTLTSGHYPDHWKRAQITPIPKVPTPKLHKDFRPKSLLFHMGKLCEQAIVNKLKDSIQTIISSTQYAYRPKLGTTDAILQLIDDITADLDCPENKYTQLACVDFSKAFDKLQPYIVIDKMRNYGINSNILNILSSFLERRMQCVKVNGTFSSDIDVYVGAPQGNDLIVEDFIVVQYADDTTFYKSFVKQGGYVASAIEKTMT